MLYPLGYNKDGAKSAMSKTSEGSQGALAYQRIIEAVQAGSYVPGDRLRETEVAARVGLSRTPVREALRRLEAEGIVEHSPRVGAVIRRLGHNELVELYEMRTVLERTAAEMAAKHASPAEIDVLDSRNAQIALCTDNPARAAALNQAFHQGLYLAARNRFLLESARALNHALMLMGPTTLAGSERLEVVTGQHTEILQGLRAGDPDRAGDAAEAHLQTSLRHRLELLGR